MNNKIHRLVFSAARGMLVAVQESAVGRGKGRHGSAARQGDGMTFAPVLWLTVLAASMMGIPVVLEQSAHAQTLPIQVDKSAPGARPVVGVAANGVPVVNIAPPNHNGRTSVNNFTQYHVGPSGLVLNNSGQNSQTQIAGLGTREHAAGQQQRQRDRQPGHRAQPIPIARDARSGG
ncbi:hypothetical protein Tamer19_12440 [Cupriavidus sp. TA19]|nr:hypothetical protein Tamer19_12440 [Cupriavidus sp. TA19]